MFLAYVKIGTDPFFRYVENGVCPYFHGVCPYFHGDVAQRSFIRRLTRARGVVIWSRACKGDRIPVMRDSRQQSGYRAL